MNAKRLAVGLTMALVMAMASSRAEAQTAIPFTAHFSGIFNSNTNIDTNNDGIPATSTMGIDITNQGNFLLQSVEELVFVDQPGTCTHINPFSPPVVPPGDAFILYARVVESDQDTGDRLFYSLGPGTSCTNLTTGTTSFTTTGTFTGGTGRFAGATGPVTTTGTAVLSIADANRHAYGSFTGATTGTLTLPHSP